MRVGSLSTVMLLGLAGCSWTGRTFTSKTTVPVKVAAGGALCGTTRVAVKLADVPTYGQVEGLVGKLELQQVSVTTVIPDGAGDSQATTATGHVGWAADQTASATTLATFNALGTSGDVLLLQSASLPDDQKESNAQPLDATVATGLAGAALAAKGAFSLEVATCSDQVPADYALEVDLGFYLEL